MRKRTAKKSWRKQHIQGGACGWSPTGGESRRQEDTKEDRSAAALPDGGDGKGKAKAVKTDRGPPPEKKPALTRAERRAKQEAEKAAKASARVPHRPWPPEPASLCSYTLR